MLPFVPQAPSVTLRVPPPSRREAKITPLRHIKPTDKSKFEILKRFDKSKFEIGKLMFIGVLCLSASNRNRPNTVGTGVPDCPKTKGFCFARNNDQNLVLQRISPILQQIIVRLGQSRTPVPTVLQEFRLFTDGHKPLININLSISNFDLSICLM